MAKGTEVTPEERRPWFDAHETTGRYRLLVATVADDGIVGYATTSPWRPKAAYQTTVESSVYCEPAAVGRGYGRALYAALFDAIADEDVHQIVAGVSLPNAASIGLHERCGFERVGVFAGWRAARRTGTQLTVCSEHDGLPPS